MIGAFLTALALYAAVHFWLSLRQEQHVLAHRAAVPAAFRDKIPLDAHQKAADYTVTRTRFGRVALAWRLLVLLGFTLGGGLDLLARAVTSPTLFVVAAFVLADAARLPLAIYSTFVIEQRFGFNRTTPRLFVVDLVRGTLLALAVGAPAAYGALWLMGHGGELWWVWLWGSWLGFSLFFAWAYPVIIAPLFHKFTPLAAGGLNDRIAALLERTGFASRGVFVMDGSRRSARASAYFTGFGRQKRIVLFDTLQSMLAEDEIEAVLAHELGHFKLRHLWRRLAGSAVLGLLGLAAFALVADRAWFQTGLGVTDPTPQAALVLFAWVGPLFAFLASPLLSAWSRRHEYEADAFAAAHADGDALVRALVRLYEHNAATLTPDPLHSAFHDSHPPAPLRIARLVSS